MLKTWASLIFEKNFFLAENAGNMPEIAVPADFLWTFSTYFVVFLSHKNISDITFLFFCSFVRSFVCIFIIRQVQSAYGLFIFIFLFFQFFLFDNIPLKNIFSMRTKSQFNLNSIKSYKSFLSQLQIILTYTLIKQSRYSSFLPYKVV